MIKKNAELSFMMMFVFIVMNFLMSMSSTLFNGILDKIAIAMNFFVSHTWYFSSLYAYGAIGKPLILILCRKISHSVLLKATLLSNIFFGILSILAANFPLLLFSRFMLGMFGTAYGVLATTSIVFLSSRSVRIHPPRNQPEKLPRWTGISFPRSRLFHIRRLYCKLP